MRLFLMTAMPLMPGCYGFAYDVLGHLVHISMVERNPVKRPVEYARYHELIDEMYISE